MTGKHERRMIVRDGPTAIQRNSGGSGQNNCSPGKLSRALKARAALVSHYPWIVMADKALRAGSAVDADAAVATGAARELSPATVLVTGASGFLGSAIAAALRARGHAIRVLARPSSPRTNLDAADTLCQGDLRDRASLAARAKGRPLSLSCRRRLSALGAKPGRDQAQQCRGHAPHHGGGAQRWRRAHRLHQQRRDLEAH